MSNKISIEQYMANLQKVINGQPNEVKRIVLKNAEKIVDYNRENQIFDKGIDSLGKALPKYRADRFNPNDKRPATRGYPKSKGSRYNLFDSGNFFDNFNVRFVLLPSYRYEIINNVSYIQEIFQQVRNQDILGLTQENAINVDKEIIKPELDKWILSIL